MAYPYPHQQNYVANPAIPYNDVIPGGIQLGKRIVIDGIVPPGSQRFSINVKCNALAPPKCDIALHFDSRFPSQVVVRNAMMGGGWLTEERAQPYFPFVHNSPFNIVISAALDQFKILVNGYHFADFQYRVVNLKSITHLDVTGQVQIYSIRYEGGNVPTAPVLQNTVMNPAIPYNDIIPGGIQLDKRIVIDGIVPPGSQRFSINVKCNALAPPNCDILLHFDPRFPSKVVVRNAIKMGGSWQTEERAQPYFPFVHNSPFNIVISAALKQFKISVNGKHFADFQYRGANLKSISHLEVTGQVQIYSIRYEGGNAPTAPVLQNTVMNPPVPYVAPIGGGLVPGKMIVISGVVNPTPKRFHINLQCGPKTEPSANVAFHFNPRFQTRKIVRNTLLNQKWGAEEDETPNFSLLPNGFFEISILCQQDAYRVAVNGQHLLEYQHRIAYNQVTFLEVDGAVRLSQVRLQ